jgi:phosphatidylglycerophosphatase A
MCGSEVPMSAKTDAPAPSGSELAAASLPTRKPRIALAIATSLGLGYIPIAPGTWGSLVGVLIYYGAVHLVVDRAVAGYKTSFGSGLPWAISVGTPIALLLAMAGVFAADRAAKFLRKKDPGCVVIDEVSGQFLTYLLAFSPANWKYLVLGLILFRVFDIWKPAPPRQAESLPGGLGILADDWVAGIYAAIGLWIARAAGL